MFAAPLFFPKLLKAALPDPSEVSPALIGKRGRVLYGDGDSGCRDPREGFRGEVSWGQRPRLLDHLIGAGRQARRNFYS